MSDKELREGLEHIAEYISSEDFRASWEIRFTMEDEVQQLLKVFRGDNR